MVNVDSYTKEQYLEYRNNRDIGAILYTYYLKNLTTGRVLTRPEFDQFYNIWQSGGEYLEKLLNFFDKHFEITVLLDTHNQEIKFY